jgi:pilus assembly protein Flp/PilA
MLKNRFNRDEEGASMVEYALLVALIAIVCIVALTGLGQSISNLFATTCNHLSSVNAAASGSAQSASC